jgi:hypothetical protein
LVGVFAAWISVNYPRAWYGSRWFVGALGVVILFITYASLWRITDHYLELSADSYFARTIPELPIAGKNCRAAIFAAVSFPWRQGRPLYNAVLFRDAKTFHPSRSSRCLLVRNSSTDGTIKLAVQVCRDQLRRPAAGTQTES